ncbi:MAG: L-seryl-tRNA(Sec) selenium transferase [Fimbriimonadaceae bacterium]|nr:L-seryl-tRNA(Sec) selenium transferase [Chthonomonadaceae bacterium]MCO5295389.1 L-seryl-tRNA(Sec) selenium transferase [Fimbriimonadaceae bacterium]
MTGLRSLPKVDVLAQHPALSSYAPALRAESARKAIAWARTELKAGREVAREAIEARAEAEAGRAAQASLRPVINASGVILHTGLGRARLAAEAVEQIRAASASHAAVEFDLAEGTRGDRQAHVETMLCSLTGAEAAHVVNNAAAAVFLSLASVASGREVVLSRGQMVEIGGSFRMPDIVRNSGCRLVEVGCTNKTRLSDYREALGEETGAILRCHPSNFRIVGFVEEPSLGELVALADEAAVPLIDDMGSGCLVDTRPYGLPHQPTLQEAVGSKAHLVTASGDKLLGGPQAGLILGRREWVERARRHPLARAVRVDKLTLAGLEATLRLYQQGRQQEIPTLRSLARPLDEVRRAARRLARAYPGATQVSEGLTEVGGGCAPGIGVPTVRVGLRCQDPVLLAKTLREANPPIVARIEDGLVWLDPRTLDDDEVRLAGRTLAGLVIAQ